MLAGIVACSGGNSADLPEHIRILENLTVYSADSEPVGEIILERGVAFGEGEEVAMNWVHSESGIGWFAGLGVAASGRIFIGDYTGLNIHVFDPDGSYLKSLGGRGPGPGEYNSIADMKVIGDYLYVYDGLKLYVNMYSVETLDLVHAINVKPYAANQDRFEELADWFPYERILRNDSTFLVGFVEHPRDSRKRTPTYNLGKKRMRKYYVMDAGGNIISEKIFEMRSFRDLLAIVNGRQIYNHFAVSFLGRPLVAMASDGHIFAAWSEDFSVQVYDPDGNYRHAFYYPHRNKSLDRDEIIALYIGKSEWNRILVQYAELPETWPALQSMLADDEGRLWIATIEEQDQVAWWVLEKTGKLIARFYWPNDRSIELVDNGYVYVRERSENGLQNMVKYRIEMD
jgi:hypothetical protein